MNAKLSWTMCPSAVGSTPLAFEWSNDGHKAATKRAKTVGGKVVISVVFVGKGTNQRFDFDPVTGKEIVYGYPPIPG